MLRRYHIARFALQHSPEREERLLAFAEKKDKNEFIDGMHEGDSENITNETVRKNIENITNATREKLKFLNDLAGIRFTNDTGTDNTILNKFFSEHHPHVEKLYKEWGQEFTYGDWSKEVVSNLTSKFMQEVQEIARRSKEKMGPQSCAYLSHESFVRQYMKSLGESDTSPEALEAFIGSHAIPNAYFDRVKQSIIFDLSDVQFNYKKQLRAMGHESEESATDEQKIEAQAIVENNRQRAVTHELAHYSLDYINKYETTSLGERIIIRLKELFNVKTLDDHPLWLSVKKAVLAAFNTGGTGWSHEDILHEGLAMLAANNRIPERNNSIAINVVDAMRHLLNETHNDAQVKKLLDTLNDDLAYLVAGNGTNPSAYDDAMRKMEATAKEEDDNVEFHHQYERHNVNEDVQKVRTNNPEIHEEINTDIERTAAEMTSARIVLEKITKAKQALQQINTLSEKYLKSIPIAERRAEGLALEKLKESFSSDWNDLNSTEQDAKILDDWEKTGVVSNEQKNMIAEKYDFSSLGLYSDLMNEDSTIVLNEQNREKRNIAVSTLAEVVANHFEPLTKIADAIESTVDDIEKGEENKKQGKEETMFDKIKRALGKQNGIHWLSFYDILKIYNIYKDAVLARYHANQNIRVYDAAKEWNFWKPLQPDLDKQAKSANDEETEKFKEYLKKDGFTYDQLFCDNGVLDQNRSNINRAKAVIDYAAEHAWLYKLDRTNGHDVYGLDYQGLWGDRTFEELVERNASSQKEEKSKGKSKVDNYPDIPLLIEDIETELKKKNIWMVLGIIERLQEKAKFSESNTWALVTILKTLRDDKDGTLREVFAAGGKGMMDAIGGIGIGQSAWTLTLFKTQRHALLEWIKAGCTSEAAIEIGEKFAKTGYVEPHSFIPEVLEHIENKLYTDPKSKKILGEDGLNHKVAKILAAQSVKGEKGNVSVFDDDEVLNGYRQYWSVTQTTTSAKATDDDFFNPANGGADIRLLWEEGINAILECTSLGQFANEPKARGYLTQMLMLDEDLKTNNPAAHANFMKETKKKFESWFSKGTNNENTRKTFGTYRTITLKAVPQLSDKNILFELWGRGLIEAEYYTSFVQGFSDAKVPAEMAKLRSLLDTLKDLKNKKAPQNEISAAKAAVDQELARTRN